MAGSFALSPMLLAAGGEDSVVVEILLALASSLQSLQLRGTGAKGCGFLALNSLILAVHYMLQ